MSEFFTSIDVLAINNKIKRMSVYGEPQEKFISSVLSEFKNGDEREQMLKAQAYYDNDGDIKEKKRVYLDRNGVPQESKVLENSKLFHPFFKKLTKQKVNYLLAKTPTIKSDDKAIDDLLEVFRTDKFLIMLNRLMSESITKGRAWAQVYYDKKSVLRFKRIPTEQIYPFWADEDHTILDALLRFYTITVYKADGSRQNVEKVEYYTPEGVWYYVKDNDGLKIDKDMVKYDSEGEIITTPSGNFTLNVPVVGNDGVETVDADGNLVYQAIDAVWGKIPFVCFKYNQEEHSLLTQIKTLVDNYDKITSRNSDEIMDTAQSIKVVKNYDGTDKEAFNQNLNTFRTAFVRGDGDVTSLTDKIEHEAASTHLESLRKDIYEFGNGVDNQDDALGNKSGVGLLFKYADLSADCDDLALMATVALKELFWFLQADAAGSTNMSIEDADFDVVFNTDTIMDESAVIKDCVLSSNLVSKQTALANHPYVKNVEDELKLIADETAAEDARQLELQKQQMNTLRNHPFF